MNIQQFTNPQFWTSLFPNWWSIIINIIDIALVAWLLYFLIKAIVGTKIMILVRGVIIFFLVQFLANCLGLTQIYEKWHTERMEAEGVTDLFNPYQNVRVGLNCLREIQDKYLASSGENCVLMVYNMGESTAKKLWAKDIYSSAYSREVIARAQELRQELTQE